MLDTLEKNERMQTVRSKIDDSVSLNLLLPSEARARRESSDTALKTKIDRQTRNRSDSFMSYSNTLEIFYCHSYFLPVILSVFIFLD